MRLPTVTMCLLLYVLQIYSANGRHNFEMGFNSCNCNKSDPDGYLSQLSCGVSKNAKRRNFQYEMEFKKEVKQFYLSMRMTLPRQEGDFMLFNVKNLNGCQILAQQSKILFLQINMQSLNRFGNIPLKCPFHKNELYYIKGFRLDMNAFPALTFETDMNFWFEYVIENNKIMQCFIKMHFFLKRNSKGGK